MNYQNSWCYQQARPIFFSKFKNVPFSNFRICISILLHCDICTIFPCKTMIFLYSRCGLTGEDLNRRWQDPHAKLHPVIYHSKGLISYIKQVLAKDIFLFCDFHGHSRKKNVFVYGCSLDQSWWPQDHEFYDDPSVYKARIVASRNTRYYSGNQKFCFLMSRLVTCRMIFFRNKTLSR